MYIKSARIQNIRSIEDFEINFDEPAGWHVLIGDNGSGKSTIIRSLALALVGPDEAKALWEEDWRNWLSADEPNGEIDLILEASNIDERPPNSSGNYDNTILSRLSFTRDSSKDLVTLKGYEGETFSKNPFQNNWGSCGGWFSVAYGPYRRFTGGDEKVSTIFSNRPKLGAHLSAFGEGVALTEATVWLKELNRQLDARFYEALNVTGIREKFIETIKRLSEKDKYIETKLILTHVARKKEGGDKESFSTSVEGLLEREISLDDVKKSMTSIIDDIKVLINSSNFLPNGVKLEKITSEDVVFRDANYLPIKIENLSDGYRSILSLTLELIRQLIRVYGEETVFKNIREDKMYIDLPGVVLIDEIDAHLHPTWQTKIGQWFLKYFPNLQFIVTTHSPLVCRAAEKGTIWKLAAPGSEEKSGQVTGVDRQRLIYGNILDAYGTEVFGEDVSRSEKSAEMLKELAALSVKSFKGKITDSERKRADQLKQILPTE